MKNILLVEDDNLLSGSMSGSLERAGYRVEVSGNGTEALKLALKNHPDIILLDIMLPGIGGLEVLKKLRANDWGKFVPVVILSNIDTDEDIMQAVKQTAQAYLIKANTSMQTVLETIEQLLK